MGTVADDIIISWCDLDPKTRYPVAVAVVTLFKRPNDKAPVRMGEPHPREAKAPD
jgi:hypothetical protein